MSGGILFKGEPLVYAKLEMLVSAISPRYQPCSRCESLLKNYMVHYVYPTWSAQPHRGVGDAPV